MAQRVTVNLPSLDDDAPPGAVGAWSDAVRLIFSSEPYQDRIPEMMGSVGPAAKQALLEGVKALTIQEGKTLYNARIGEPGMSDAAATLVQARFDSALSIIRSLPGRRRLTVDDMEALVVGKRDTHGDVRRFATALGSYRMGTPEYKADDKWQVHPERALRWLRRAVARGMGGDAAQQLARSKFLKSGEDVVADDTLARAYAVVKQLSRDARDVEGLSAPSPTVAAASGGQAGIEVRVAAVERGIQEVRGTQGEMISTLRAISIAVQQPRVPAAAAVGAAGAAAGAAGAAAPPAPPPSFHGSAGNPTVSQLHQAVLQNSQALASIPDMLRQAMQGGGGRGGNSDWRSLPDRMGAPPSGTATMAPTRPHSDRMRRMIMAKSTSWWCTACHSPNWDKSAPYGADYGVRINQTQLTACACCGTRRQARVARARHRQQHARDTHTHTSDTTPPAHTPQALSSTPGHEAAAGAGGR